MALAQIVRNYQCDDLWFKIYDIETAAWNSLAGQYHIDRREEKKKMKEWAKTKYPEKKSSNSNSIAHICDALESIRWKLTIYNSFV